MFGFEIEIEQFLQLHHYNDTYCFVAQPLYHLESQRFEPRFYIKLILKDLQHNLLYFQVSVDSNL